MMTPLINYFFECTRPFKRALPKKCWVELCVKNEMKKLQCINFVFCSDKYLLEINSEYLKSEHLTDVISFNTNPTENIENVFGDVYISIPRVRENSRLFNTCFDIELARVMIHGVLHLVGYNDKTLKEQRTMTKKENYYLNKIKNV